MRFSLYLSVWALIGLTACEPTTGPTTRAAPSAQVTAGLAPPSGRTSAERQARKNYYRGPRGDEF
jgi:hypothetical protein